VQSRTHDLTFTGTEVRKRFVTWDRGEAEREWACLRLLAEHAPGLAPRPLRREIVDGAPVVVMERLPGVPLGDAPLTPAQTVALGEALRRLYDVPLEDVRAAGIAERAYGPTSRARATVLEWLGDTYDLAACQDAGLVADAVARALVWLDSPDALPEPRLCALGIADLNPANVLWDGQRCRLVDFEDGGLSDPAYELADHLEHIASRLTGVLDGPALVDAVGLDEAGRERLEAYRPLWAAFWLAMLLPGNGGWRRNPAGTTEAQARHLNGLLDR
jgi:Ser/Thr protein kinase RdoA (MazF antagonist)